MMDSFLEEDIRCVKTVRLEKKIKGKIVLNIAFLIYEVEGKTGIFPCASVLPGLSTL